LFGVKGSCGFGCDGDCESGRSFCPGGLTPPKLFHRGDDTSSPAVEPRLRFLKAEFSGGKALRRDEKVAFGGLLSRQEPALLLRRPAQEIGRMLLRLFGHPVVLPPDDRHAACERPIHNFLHLVSYVKSHRLLRSQAQSIGSVEPPDACVEMINVPIVKESDPEGVIAAFDVGSNSIKMTVARRDGSRVEEFLWRSATVRLGAGIEATGRLADDRIDAALNVLRGFATEARAAGATRLIGVATEATRVAANGKAFLDRVRAETGLELQVISGDQEAKLTFRGLAATLDLTGDVVVADVGGGSTEIICAEHGTFRWGQSIPLGSGRLTDRLVSSDPPSVAELIECRNAAGAALNGLPLPPGPIDRLIVVGGTGEYLVRLVPAGRPATIADLDDVLQRLTMISAQSLAQLIEIPEARARVLPAGVAIVRTLAERTQPRAIEGAQSGIRTGLLLAAFAGEL
jgi:exopolyphosphatase/guanosine-5'-triphosphate,3'-diphosphate pyrophosphatase